MTLNIRLAAGVLLNAGPQGPITQSELRRLFDRSVDPESRHHSNCTINPYAGRSPEYLSGWACLLRTGCDRAELSIFCRTIRDGAVAGSSIENLPKPRCHRSTGHKRRGPNEHDNRRDEIQRRDPRYRNFFPHRHPKSSKRPSDDLANGEDAMKPRSIFNSFEELCRMARPMSQP
jgi:hypothetical protein